MAERFSDRREAGRRLSERLLSYAGRTDVLVLGLPRGGVPVAYEVARRLKAPLDVFIVRKLGVPWHREVGMGAIASGGVRVLNGGLIAQLEISPAELDRIVAEELEELARRSQAFRGDRPPLNVKGRTVIVVDDGLATGATMRAAVTGLRRLGAARVVVAVPVGARESCRTVATEAYKVVCMEMPDPFRVVGLWYRNFPQTEDEEVRDLLDRADSETGGVPRARGQGMGRGDIATG